MFPDIDAHDGIMACFHIGRVLVGGAGDLKLAVRMNQPAPAAAKAFDRGVAELLLELVEGAECLVDGPSQGPAGLAAAIALHDLPEHGVIGIATAVILDGSANALGKL